MRTGGGRLRELRLVQFDTVFFGVVDEGLGLGTEAFLFGAVLGIDFLDVCDGSLGGVDGSIVIDDSIQEARVIESFEYGPELLLGHGD